MEDKNIIIKMDNERKNLMVAMKILRNELKRSITNNDSAHMKQILSRMNDVQKTSNINFMNLLQ